VLSRPRTLPYPQFLLAAAVGIVTVSIAVLEPARIDMLYVLGAALVLIGCGVMYVIWRAEPSVHTGWIVIVPLVDIVATVPIRQAASDVLPAAGVLVTFPVGWLAFAFPAWAIAVGVLGTALLPVSALLDESSATPAQWMSVLVLPATMALFAIAVAAVGRDLRRQRTRAQRADTRMSEALTSSERNAATLRALLDATDDAVSVFDVRGDPLLVNAVAAELTRRAGVRGAPHPAGPMDIYAADRKTKVELGPEFMGQALAGVFVAPRLVWVGAPGDQLAIRFVVRPVTTEDGDAIGFVMVGNDVTELVHAVDVRDRFLDTVGHEFRTPLTVILGNTDIALAAHSADRDRWERVDRAAERLLRMVERLIAAGRAELEPRTGDTAVSAVVSRSVLGAERRAAERGIDFAVIVDETVRARIAANDLAAVAEELARNAVEFTPAGGSVVVEVRRERGDVLVEVADTGVGMTADERAHAFERFYRTSYAQDAAVQGAGLGLAIARSLAESNGATLSLASNAPAGTVATLRVGAV
jgi:two-component system phosphate regulon sensor histidine kinase PhoR